MITITIQSPKLEKLSSDGCKTYLEEKFNIFIKEKK